MRYRGLLEISRVPSAGCASAEWGAGGGGRRSLLGTQHSLPGTRPRGVAAGKLALAGAGFSWIEPKPAADAPSNPVPSKETS